MRGSWGTSRRLPVLCCASSKSDFRLSSLAADVEGHGLRQAPAEAVRQARCGSRWEVQIGRGRGFWREEASVLRRWMRWCPGRLRDGCEASERCHPVARLVRHQTGWYRSQTLVESIRSLEIGSRNFGMFRLLPRTPEAAQTQSSRIKTMVEKMSSKINSTYRTARKSKLTVKLLCY